MWNLEYELIAILLTAAIIGLLMGRFLCKSGEADEKAKKVGIMTVYKALQLDFNKSEARLAEQISISHVYEDSLSEQKQSITNLTTKLDSSDKHAAKHLEDVKILAKYKARFEALSKEFEVQTSKIEILKNEKSSNIETIDAFETSSRILEQKLSSLNAKHNKTLQVLEELSLLNEKQKKESEKESVAQKKQSEEQKRQSEKQSEEQKRQSEKQSEEQKRQSDKQSEEQKRQSDKQKKQIDVLVEREIYLLKELKNFKLDKHDRLVFLEKEYEGLSTKLNTAIDERDDLMTRIRAISSVVGAVGVEEE